MLLKKAQLWNCVDNNRVQCNLCHHQCLISLGKRGKCGVRENRDGILNSLVYGKPISLAIDPIEKKPLFHFFPGSDILSLATVGCNLSCDFCQNHSISQQPPGSAYERSISPEDVVLTAKDQGCQSIAFTYTEPTIFFEYAYDIAKLADKKNISSVFVTNGYMTIDALKTISPYLAAANVDVKSIDPHFYKEFCGAPKAPRVVLENIEFMIKNKIHVEVTNLVIPTRNDEKEQIKQLCQALISLSENIPVHFSAYHPDYKVQHIPRTTSSILEKTARIAKEAGLRYVYVGNVPGSNLEHTLCYNCGKILIKRVGFNIVENNLKNSKKCPWCNVNIHIIGDKDGKS